MAPKTAYKDAQLGDIRYIDINGDGWLNEDDRVEVGRSTTPEMMFGFLW